MKPLCTPPDGLGTYRDVPALRVAGTRVPSGAVCDGKRRRPGSRSCSSTPPASRCRSHAATSPQFHCPRVAINLHSKIASCDDSQTQMPSTTSAEACGRTCESERLRSVDVVSLACEPEVNALVGLCLRQPLSDRQRWNYVAGKIERVISRPSSHRHQTSLAGLASPSVARGPLSPLQRTWSAWQCTSCQQRKSTGRRRPRFKG